MAENCFVQSLQLKGFLSFPPDSAPFKMEPLNILIGPNGAGKSNLIEAFELLHAAPTNFSTAIRDGGGAGEWIWAGSGNGKAAQIDAVIGPSPTGRPLRYRIEFTESGQRVEIIDEAIEEIQRFKPEQADVFFYYRFQQGRPSINVKGDGKNRPYKERRLERDSLLPDQSVLSQRKDPDLYPELTWVGQAFGDIRTFREWSFGRYGELRRPQQANEPIDQLHPDSRNLALVLNEISHRRGRELDALVERFLPRFQRLSTRVHGGTVQFYLHEKNLDRAIPATRLSDGTIRFLAILAALMAPSPPRLLCIEEPEMGLHPDAMAVLAEMFREASSRMQLIVTTHSDVLISALTESVDSVVVCENSGNGTTLNRLEAAKLSSWLDKYRLGELWRIGEIGGNL